MSSALSIQSIFKVSQSRREVFEILSEARACPDCTASTSLIFSLACVRRRRSAPHRKSSVNDSRSVLTGEEIDDERIKENQTPTRRSLHESLSVPLVRFSFAPTLVEHFFSSSFSKLTTLSRKREDES